MLNAMHGLARRPLWHVRFVALVVFAVLGLAGVASARCGTFDPVSTREFAAFHEAAVAEYRVQERTLTTNAEAFSLVYGHALGRLALAAGNDPARLQGFDCVTEALDLLIDRHFSRRGEDVVREIMNSANRLNDRWVESRYGVRDFSPLDRVFAAAGYGGYGGSVSSGGSGGGASPVGAGVRASGIPSFAELQSIMERARTALGQATTYDAACDSSSRIPGTDLGSSLGLWLLSCDGGGCPQAADQFVNICDRGVISITSSGVEYFGHFDGVNFAGYWTNGPSCSEGGIHPNRYSCSTEMFGNNCWGELVWQGLDYIPEGKASEGYTDFGYGYVNFCGKRGVNKRPSGASLDDGPHYFWASKD